MIFECAILCSHRYTVRWYRDGDAISVVLHQSLTDVSYDLPLTLKTLVPSQWAQVEVRQGARRQVAEVIRDQGHVYVLYQAVPNGEVVKLSGVRP